VPLGVDVPDEWLLFSKHMGLLNESIWFGDLIGSTMFFFFVVILIKIYCSHHFSVSHISIKLTELDGRTIGAHLGKVRDQ
jgi:hypothetical protein